MMNFFRRLFGPPAPPPAPPEDRRDWNDDWRVGDIAECIVDGVLLGWHPAVKPWNRPAFHERLTVSGFFEGEGADHTLRYFLRFSDWPRPLPTSAFRKVRPVQTSAETSVGERILKAKPGPDKVRKPARTPSPQDA